MAVRFLVEAPRTDRPVAGQQLHQSEARQTRKAVRCSRFTKAPPAGAASGAASPFGSGSSHGLAGYHSTRTTSTGQVLIGLNRLHWVAAAVATCRGCRGGGSDSTPLSVTTIPPGACRERGTRCESPLPHRTRWPGGPPGPSRFGVGSPWRGRLRRTAGIGVRKVAIRMVVKDERWLGFVAFRHLWVPRNPPNRIQARLSAMDLLRAGRRRTGTRGILRLLGVRRLRGMLGTGTSQAAGMGSLGRREGAPWYERVA